MFIYEFMGEVLDAVKTDTDSDETNYDPHLHRKVPHPTSARLVPLLSRGIPPNYSFITSLVSPSHFLSVTRATSFERKGSRLSSGIGLVISVSCTSTWLPSDLHQLSGYSETMMHMLKGSIGAGILAMPDGFRRVGVIAGSIGLFAIGSFATYCVHMLIGAQYVLCKRQKRGYMSYSNSIKYAMMSGPPCLQRLASLMSCLVKIILIVWQLGLCCVYSVFMGENVKQVCDFYNLDISIRLHILIGFIPLFLLNMVKSLKLLSPLSSISNLLTLLGLILVFYYLTEKDLELESEMFQLKEPEDFPVFVGTTLFALEAVGVILALEFNMDDPKRFVGYCGLLNVAMVAILGLYCLVGAFGYMKYGSEIEASITLNLPPHDKKAQAAKLLLALSIAMSQPLQNFVAYNQIWMKLSKKYEGHKQVVADYSLRVILVIIPVGTAIAVPTLGPIISLAGALCLSLLAIVFPALMDICIWYPKDYGFAKYKLFRDILIILLGLFALVSGVYTSLLEMMHMIQSPTHE